MEPVNWGVLSTSNFAQERSLPAMQQGRLSRIAAICSRDLGAAKAVAERMGIPKAYGSYEELLADPEIEVIYNPLPNHLHVPWTVKAAEAGKHVLCEKPIALTAAEAETLIPVRDRTGVRIEEAFMVRHHPHWLKARELVRQGRIGEPRAIQGFFSYRNLDPQNIRNIAEVGGGGIYDIGCYPIVTARYLFGSEPTRAVSLIERDPTSGTDRLATAILDFPEGQASFVCATQLVKYQRMQVFGTEGRIEILIPFNAPPDEPCRIFVDDGSQLGDASAEQIVFDVVNQYTLQGDAFSAAVRNGTPPEFPLEDSVRNMRVIDAVFRSAQSGGWERV